MGAIQDFKTSTLVHANPTRMFRIEAKGGIQSCAGHSAPPDEVPPLSEFVLVSAVEGLSELGCKLAAP